MNRDELSLCRVCKGKKTIAQTIAQRFNPLFHRGKRMLCSRAKVKRLSLYREILYLLYYREFSTFDCTAAHRV